MATSPQVVPGSSTTQEYIVRVPRDRKKRLCMFRFGVNSDVDFTKYTNVRLERENNLREYKTANDIDVMPKFGAGSEFGREAKEEARRKKYGVMLKKYKPEDQPWHMKIGSKQNCKRYKGVREGTISDNTSYYIFTQCADGAFEAFPVDHWYNFNAVIKYKYLNSEEAEEEFKKRDKTMNLFSVMLRKKLRPEDHDAIDAEEGEEKKSKAKTKKEKDFLLTDLDDWAVMSDEDDDKDDKDDSDKDEKADKPPKKDPKKKPAKAKKNSKSNSDDEAIEESDEGDMDGNEMDYVTDDSASSMSDVENRDKDNKYEEKGVDQEDGLRKLIDSGASSDEEENKEEEEDKDKEKEEKAKKESDSSSSSSGSDSDLEAKLFNVDKPVKKKANSKKNPPSQQRSATPTAVESEDKKDAVKTAAQKRKADPEVATSSKKVRTESPVTTSSAPIDGICEEAIRRYLMRKPMSTKDLLQKFKSKKLNLSNEQLTTSIAQLLRKINPERQTINKTLYLSLKKPD